MNDVAFDLDGVVIDSIDIFRMHFWNIYGVDIGRPERYHKQFNFVEMEKHGIPYEIFGPEIQVALAKYHHILPSVEGSLQAIEKFYMNEREPILFITARESSYPVKQATHKWLKKHLYGWDVIEGVAPEFHIPYEVIFVPSSKVKAQVLKDRGIKYFVDDRYRTANDLAEFLTVSFLFNQPWNFGRKAHAKVLRIHNLMQMIEYLELKKRN